MSIEIIKQGRLPEEKRWSFICRNCDTHFTAQKKDGQYFSNQRDGEALTVSCPLCKTSVTSYTEYKTHLEPQHRGWQDYVLETNPQNR